LVDRRAVSARRGVDLLVVRRAEAGLLNAPALCGRRLDGQLQHYAAAIGTVGAIPTVTSALQDREVQRLRLQTQLAALEAARTKAPQPFSAAIHTFSSALSASPVL
jgi:hypothetical protein